MEVSIKRLHTSAKLLSRGMLIVLGLVLWLALPINTYADDTEDLMNVYGLTLGNNIKSDLELELESLENDINSMKVQQEIIDEYNSILQIYLDKQEEEIDRVLNSISSYQRDNDILLEAINENMLTVDIDTLLRYDSTYKTNTSRINELLSNLNSIRLDYSYKSITNDLEYQEELLQETMILYADSIDTFELGDISGIEWIMPNDMYKTSSYGYRIDPMNPNNIRFHSGTDYRAPIGTPIGALFNGEVISCGWSDTAGYFVTVMCGDNIKYFICHCSEIYVTVGQQVNQYDIIASSGNTGSRTTGPHLHLALYINGVTYDVSKLFT